MTETIDHAAAFRRAFQRIVEMAQTDSQIAGVFPDQKVTEAIQEPGLSYVEIIARALAGYANRPALGSRSYEIREKPNGRRGRHFLPAFDTITYGELAHRIEAIASSWRHHPLHRVAPGEFACFIAFASSEMVTLDLACAYAQSIAVPLQANLPAPDMMEVLGDTAPAVLIATIDNLELAAGYALQQDSVRSLVVIDVDEADDDERGLMETVRTRFDEAGGRIALATFGELVDYGASFDWTPLPRRPEGDDAMTMLMYTSGSTGTPKGAIIHERMCSQLWTASPPMPSIQLAYAPMNHFMGRNIVFGTLAQGGTSYFTLKSDMSTLFDDLRIVRPTFLMFMPRVAEIIYQHYQSELQQRIGAGEDPDSADASVRAEMARNFIGDRIVAGGVGSAPTAPEVQAFMRECFDIAFSEGYSSTEGSSTALISGGRVQRNVVIDYKLIDVPELGYYTSDKPYPRGELLIKSRLAVKGYFKRPEATAKIFDEEGWLHTGDIMAEEGPDQLKWLDRRNNVIKLSQAEFVAIGPLEATFLGNSKLIRQIYVYGSSFRSFLLAVVVPDTTIARARLGHEASLEELRELALADLKQAARQAGLKSFEIPRDVLVELEPFSHENGLLSSVRKPLRPKLKERYQDALEAMYREMDRRQQEELAMLRGESEELSTLERVAGALKATLGLEALEHGSSRSYSDLGGDSLGAVSFSLLLEEIFGIAVPVSVILSPTATPERLARYIDSRRNPEGEVAAASCASVHGADAARIRASELTLDAFLDEQTLRAAELSAPPSEVRTVLLTGATGFLGRFLCLEWMEDLSQSGGKLICVVRAADCAGARDRLDEAIGTADPVLASRFHELAQGHLEVIAGDLAAPRLGLDAATFSRLAGEVDQIVHPGALVNHLLSYRNLFEPNVAGTAELIRLALLERQKRFDYVSTFGVPQMHPGLAGAPDDADIRKAAPEMTLSDGYAAGYGISKWASEVLLREANERYGLPVTVYRPDMIMAHSRFRGQINVPDMFTRLLFSLVVTGLAPASFYEPEGDGSRARVHYDGLPVDFLAAAMQQLGSSPYSGFRCFNTISAHHDDGISLDTITDWVATAGYPIERIASHAEWMDRFAVKLRNLPDEQRQHSSIDILGHFDHPHPARPPAVRNDGFVAAVETLSAGPGVPQLSEAYIHKYLNDMQLLGLFPQETGNRASRAREN